MESATTRAPGAGVSSRPTTRRVSTETKHSTKTTEFWAMIGVIAGILVSAALIKGGDTNGTDEFIARQAWLYVAIVASAYFISRGLATSGSREPSDEDGDRDRSEQRGWPRPAAGEPRAGLPPALFPGPAEAGLTCPRMKARLRRLWRAIKIAARDEQIPRPVRVAAGFGLLPIPGPVDEIVLVLIAPVLILYRHRFAVAWEQAA